MRNADLPIHSLPAELLLRIFEQFIRPAYLPGKPLSQRRPRDEGPRRPWAILMRVCRHWRALIRTSASFWRDIVISKDTKWFNLALGRLRGAPFRIELTSKCSLKTVLPMLKRRANQIEKLVFQGGVRNADVHHLSSFLSCSFPLLSSLTLKMMSSHYISFVQSSVYSSSPLKWLDLTRASLPWTDSLLTHLEVLSLTDCRSSTLELPFPKFLDVLEHGKRLRYLCLIRSLCGVLDPQTTSPPGRLVTLPELQHLTCRDEAANIARLMTHLCTPAISCIKLLGECHDIDVDASPTAHAALLPEDARTRVPVLQSITRASLEVAADENYLRCLSPISFEMSLFGPDGVAYWDEEPWVDRALWQLPNFLGAALTELEVLGFLNVSRTTWDHVFDAFPALHKLVVCEDNFESVPLPMLRSLAAPPAPHSADRPSSDGNVRAVRVRCPALKHLRIDGWSWSRRALGQILDCVRVRAAHGSSRLEYFGVDGIGIGWGPELLPVLEKYRTRFLVVVDEFVVDKWK